MEPIELRSDSRSKVISASPGEVYAAISDPERLARWWGPAGFTNTIHKFDFAPGGQWLLTMHGPDGKSYPNESRIVRVEPGRAFEIEHLSGHHFFLSLELSAEPAGTRVHWRQTFDTVEHYARIAEFVARANEENLERLAREVVATRPLVWPPDPEWAGKYADEAGRIALALADLDHAVHHIGSTAINGIYAKPVIDMLLLVDDLQALDRRAEALAGLGYEALGEYGIPERRYFRKGSPPGGRSHHLHAFVRGSIGAVRHLAFRDYMNAHPEVAQEYSALKRRLSDAHADDKGAYVAGKDAFVKHHEAVAVAWYTRDPGPRAT